MKKLRRPVKNKKLTKEPINDLEEYLLQQGIEKLIEQSGTFQFLNNEEDLYTTEDIK